jgi:hypothetical protein
MKKKQPKNPPPKPVANAVESSLTNSQAKDLKGVEKNKGGRPQLPIDLEVVRKLASIHCTKREIANVVGCHVDTLYTERFTEVLQKGEDEGKMSLKRKMFEVAMQGNTAMLIWLSKQHLGMVDKQPEQAIQANYTVVIHEVPK